MLDTLLRRARRIPRRLRRKFKTSLTRNELFQKIKPSDLVLEVGPFTHPNVSGPNVRYFDVLDREALIERAGHFNYPTETSVEIDYVSPTGDMSIIQHQFDVVISSHCIEHQPDLIHHLQNVGRILKPGGLYLIVAPDKRFCFDHFFAESRYETAVEAFAERRVFHTMKSVTEHRTHVTHNDAKRHWRGDHGSPTYLENPAISLVAKQDYLAMNGRYIDAHAWYFTPKSFQSITKRLHAAKLSPLMPVHVYETPVDMLEFCAVLQRPA